MQQHSNEVDSDGGTQLYLPVLVKMMIEDVCKPIS